MDGNTAASEIETVARRFNRQTHDPCFAFFSPRSTSFALGIGLGAVWARARALRERPFDASAAHRAFTAENWWGVPDTEKATSYYMHNDVFRGKLFLFLVVFGLELWPMITLIRWRRAERQSRGTWQPSDGIARRLGIISYVEVALLVAIVTAAVAMARGYGSRNTG